jgi:ribosomal protein L31E
LKRDKANSLRGPISKKPTVKKRAGRVVQAVRAPASKHEDLNSNPSAAKKSTGNKK